MREKQLYFIFFIDYSSFLEKGSALSAFGTLFSHTTLKGLVIVTFLSDLTYPSSEGIRYPSFKIPRGGDLCIESKAKTNS
jgi:hypothetical protein